MYLGVIFYWIRTCLILSQMTYFRLFQKGLQTTISNLMKVEEKSPNGLKTLWEKEKLHVTSNFSFSHNVFKRLVLQTRKNQGLFGEELILYLICQFNYFRLFQSTATKDMMPKILTNGIQLSE